MLSTGCHSYGNLIWQNKTGFLLSNSCINTTTWMHHINTNKMHWKKAKWKWYKKVTCCFEQILEETAHKKAVIRPPTPHLTNHPSKTNKTYWALLVTNSKIMFSMYTYTWTCECWPTSKDTGWSVDISGAIDDRDRWWERERVKDLYTVSMTWWWWWWWQ